MSDYTVSECIEGVANELERRAGTWTRDDNGDKVYASWFFDNARVLRAIAGTTSNGVEEMSDPADEDGPAMMLNIPMMKPRPERNVGLRRDESEQSIGDVPAIADAVAELDRRCSGAADDAACADAMGAGYEELEPPVTRAEADAAMARFCRDSEPCAMCAQLVCSQHRGGPNQATKQVDAIAREVVAGAFDMMADSYRDANYSIILASKSVAKRLREGAPGGGSSE